MQLQSIPLSSLHASPLNVRKHDTVSIDDLVSSIEAHGLLQNLTVVEAEYGYEVVAGSRRRRALEQLVEKGVIAVDYLVPCIVIEAHAAHEVSTAENVIREAMHPADEFEAFRALVADNNTPTDIAVRFGCTELHVNRLLKLANVSPKIIEIYRADGIQLDQVMALAITDDHAAQEKVWAGTRVPWEREPARLRRALTTKELSVDSDPIAKFVGAPAYEKAGGNVRKDLFETDGAGEYMADINLARALAEEKLQKRAEQIKKDGWSWVEVRIDFPNDEERKFSREYAGYQGAKAVWSDEVKGYAGVVVSVGSDGKASATYGLVRPGDKKKAAEVTAKKAGKAPKPAKEPGDLSFPATQRLQGIRTAVLRAELATNSRVALAALAATLHGECSDVDDIVRIGQKHLYQDRPDRAVTDGIEESPAHEQFEALAEAAIAAVPSHVDHVFEWLLSQPLQATLDMLTIQAAGAIVAADKAQPGRNADPGAIFMQLAGVDMADHWAPDAEWLASIPKKAVVQAVLEACGKVAAARVEKLKGTDISNTAAELLAGKRWLPMPLRAPAAKKVRKPRDSKQKAAADDTE